MVLTSNLRVARAATLLLAWLAGVAVSACSSTDADVVAPRAAIGCVDDSPHCIAERGNTLKVLMGDRSKAWMRAPASPGTYAAGVRLWAFKQKKRELTCDELGHARREADGAAPSLRSAAGSLTPGQISRGIILAQEVSRELGNEFGRRCRA